MAKAMASNIEIRIGCSPKRAYRHSVPHGAVVEVVRNNQELAFRTPAWTYVVYHTSDAGARRTERLVLGNADCHLEVEGEVLAVLAANHEAVQAEGVALDAIGAFARHRGLSVTRVSASGAGAELYLLHGENAIRRHDAERLEQ
jgi:hypothetical protein